MEKTVVTPAVTANKVHLVNGSVKQVFGIWLRFWQFYMLLFRFSTLSQQR